MESQGRPLSLHHSARLQRSILKGRGGAKNSHQFQGGSISFLIGKLVDRRDRPTRAEMTLEGGRGKSKTNREIVSMVDGWNFCKV